MTEPTTKRRHSMISRLGTNARSSGNRCFGNTLPGFSGDAAEQRALGRKRQRCAVLHASPDTGARRIVGLSRKPGAACDPPDPRRLARSGFVPRRKARCRRASPLNSSPKDRPHPLPASDWAGANRSGCVNSIPRSYVKLRTYWDPRMRQNLLDYIAEGGDGLCRPVIEGARLRLNGEHEQKGYTGPPKG